MIVIASLALLTLGRNGIRPYKIHEGLRRLGGRNLQDDSDCACLMKQECNSLGKCAVNEGVCSDVEESNGTLFSVKACEAADDFVWRCGLGVLLSTAAGMCTLIGASIVYFEPLLQMASNKFLAVGMGFAGGIMMFISLYEIISKSEEGFTSAENGGTYAKLYAIMAFTLGVLMMYGVEYLVHKLTGYTKDDVACDIKNAGSNGGCCNLDLDQAKAERNSKLSGDVKDVEIMTKDGDENNQNEDEKSRDQKLAMTGFITALAVGLHNFPEGMAAFFGTFTDDGVAVSLVFAIALHNIPEGLCVAVPVYFGSGSKHKGFLAALLSGLSEPIGALIGWGILAGSQGSNDGITIVTTDDNIVFGLMFGIIAGMMVMIVVREILPTAYRVDSQDKCTTHSFVCGMIIMGLSIFLIEL
jgi:ZIP family zinc transporter